MDRLEKYLEMARTMGLKVHEEKMSCHDGLLIDWFDGIRTAPVIESTPEPVKPKRLPPLLSKEEKERLTPEQQKIIARIRRKRRKIAQELEDIEGQKNPVQEFGLLEASMESWRLGEV